MSVLFVSAWCAASARAGCAVDENKVACTGCNFDTQDNLDLVRKIDTRGCYANLGETMEDPNGLGVNTPPEGWNWEGNGYKLIKQECSSWGGLHSDSGPLYLGIQRSGRIWRTLTKLEQNELYVLTFLAAERPNGPNNGPEPDFHITVNDARIASGIRPYREFAKYTYHFFSDNQGEAKIEFTMLDQKADVTLFLDNVEIFKSLACGDGASCHEPLPPRTSYTCRCDGVGYKGHDVAGKQASCKMKSNGEALDEELQALKETVGAIEDGAVELAAQTAGLKITLDANSASDQTLQGAFDAMKDEFAAMKDQVADLNQQLVTLTDVNKSLKKVLAKTFAVGAVPANNGGSGKSYAPSVSADGAGSIDLDIQEGKHATVNGDALLTGEEVREMIRSAVSDLLEDMGTALE